MASIRLDCFEIVISMMARSVEKIYVQFLNVRFTHLFQLFKVLDHIHMYIAQYRY